MINVGNTQIKPTALAHNLGVIFDRYLNLESHITFIDLHTFILEILVVLEICYLMMRAIN